MCPHSGRWVALAHGGLPCSLSEQSSSANESSSRTSPSRGSPGFHQRSARGRSVRRSITCSVWRLPVSHARPNFETRLAYALDGKPGRAPRGKQQAAVRGLPASEDRRRLVGEASARLIIGSGIAASGSSMKMSRRRTWSATSRSSARRRTARVQRRVAGLAFLRQPARRPAPQPGRPAAQAASRQASPPAGRPCG